MIQLPGFVRACYLSIRKYLIHAKENDETKNELVKIQELHGEKQTGGQQVGTAEKSNLSIVSNFYVN